MKISDERKKDLLELEKRLGVKFKNLELLNLALTHSSYANEIQVGSESYERLEFLGDAVLELASSDRLYKKFPTMPEGDLTKTRASIVCSESLAKFARKLDLGEMILFGHGEKSTGGKNRNSNLEDVFEAVIGAIYLDQGWETAKDYVLRQLKNAFDNVKIQNVPDNYKSRLQEKIQQTVGRTIEYVELDSFGPDHAKSYECAVKIDGKILGRGVGHSKKEAEQIAAKEALTKI